VLVLRQRLASDVAAGGARRVLAPAHQPGADSPSAVGREHAHERELRTELERERDERVAVAERDRVAVEVQARAPEDPDDVLARHLCAAVVVLLARLPHLRDRIRVGR